MPATKIKCVFVHGWGMNRQIWQPLISRLPEWIDVQLVDLPGHGRLATDCFDSLDDLTQSLQQQVSEPAVWIGWSLGGLAVCQLALQQPSRVIAMMQVASSPCFTRRDDWSVAVENSVFEAFERSLQTDFSATIQRFLALQLRGSENARQRLRELKQILAQQPMPNPGALKAGLDLLRHTDLRDQLDQLSMPVHWLLGKQDGLVNYGLLDELQGYLPAAEFSLFEKSAHAPFLSHMPEFNQQLLAFIQPLRSC